MTPQPKLKWAGLAVLLLPTVLLFLAMTVLFLATPFIAADLDAGSTQVLWINDIYGFAMAGLLLTMGTLGDRLGRRRLLMAGAAVFGVASAVAGFAPNVETMIGARALMGVGAAALMPSTLSLISNMFTDARQRGVAIGMWAASVSAGVALGPLIGGILLESFTWTAAFLIGVPVMALVLVAAPLLIPEYRAPSPGRIDAASVLLSMAALLPFVYGVKEFAHGGASAQAVLPVLVGLAAGAVFIRRQRRLESPLLDVGLFANRTFSGALAVFLLAAVGVGGIYLLFTQYLQLVADQSPLRAGLWILPAALALVAVSVVAPMVARRVQPAYVIAAGLLLSAAGYLVLTQVESVSGLPLLVTGFYILYPGIAPVMALVPELVIGSAPEEKAGEASAVESTASDLGVALGVALMGSIGTAVFTSTMPEGAPDNLPAALEAGLVAPAKEAFTSGLNVASGVAAVLAAGAAVLSLTVLRRRPAERTEPSLDLAA